MDVNVLGNKAFLKKPQVSPTFCHFERQSSHLSFALRYRTWCVGER